MFKTLLIKASNTPFLSFGFGKSKNSSETGKQLEGWESEGQVRYSKPGSPPKGGTQRENLGFACRLQPFFDSHSFSLWLCLCALLIFLAACASSTPRPTKKTGNSYTVGGKRYYPLSSAAGFTQRGLASWYGRKFHGRLTSNGERYNMYGRTAAHKTLPFNTYVRVTNLKNGKQTVVRINDRGPFVRGRIIDLTYTAAHSIEMAEDGVVPVKIEALGYARKKRKAGKWVQVYEKPASYEVGAFTIQVGAFAERENALRLYASLKRKYGSASVNVYDQGNQRFYRVRVGKYSRLDKAEAAAERLQGQGFPNAFAVASDK